MVFHYFIDRMVEKLYNVKHQKSSKLMLPELVLGVNKQ